MAFTLRPIVALNGDAVLPLAAAKAHLRIEQDFTDEDDLIAALRDAALSWIEAHTGRSLQARAFEWRGSPDATGVLDLGVRPLVSVTTTTFDDGSGGTPATVIVRDVLGDARLLPGAGTSWSSGGEGSVYTVTFVAGYADAQAQAPALLAAAKMLLGQMYEIREQAVTGTIVSDVPFGVTQLCRPFRRIPV